MTQTNQERAAQLRETAFGIMRTARGSAQFADQGYRDEINRAQSRAIGLLARADMLDPPSAQCIPTPTAQRVRPRSLDRALLLIAQQFGKEGSKDQMVMQ